MHRWVEAEGPRDWMRQLEADEENYPYPFWDKLKEQGFFGIGIPEEWGGLGGNLVMQMISAREFARTADDLIVDLGPDFVWRRQDVDLCSLELVQKPVIAGVPLLATLSAASTLAVEQARAHGLRLISLARPDSLLES